MDIESLKKTVRDLEERERGTIFEAAHAIGEAGGRKAQAIELIQKFEEDRKVVEVAGKPVVTTARDPRPEKR